MRIWLCDELRKIKVHLINFFNAFTARSEQTLTTSCLDPNALSPSDGASGCSHMDSLLIAI